MVKNIKFYTTKLLQTVFISLSTLVQTEVKVLKKCSQQNLNLSRLSESQTPQRDIVCVPQRKLKFRLVVNLLSANLYVTSCERKPVVYNMRQRQEVRLIRNLVFLKWPCHCDRFLCSVKHPVKDKSLCIHTVDKLFKIKVSLRSAGQQVR